jgi:RND family efflux transporter MFP subunit
MNKIEHCPNKDVVLIVMVLAVTAVFSSCSGSKGTVSGAAAVKPASMRQLYAEQGTPVSTRSLKGEDFSVYLDYPSVLEADSQATAYAGLTDVVRAINSKVGERVKRDDVIVEFSDDNARLLEAQAAFDGAQTAFKRISALYKTHDVSRQQFDQAQSQYDEASASLKAMHDTIYVRAPIDGYITQMNARLNQNAKAGAPLFTVTNSGGFEAKFYVGPGEINRIAVGQRVFVDTPPEAGKKSALEGRITQTAYTMDSAKQAFLVTASFSRSGADVTLATLAKQGYYSGKWIDAVVEVYHNPKALVLSRSEMLQSPDGTWSAFIDEDGKAKKLAVTPGETKGLEMEIKDGLKAGDILVSEGASVVEDGDKLNIVPSLLKNETLADAE